MAANPASRSISSYCRPNARVFSGFTDDDRYRAVNICSYHSHRTVEVRCHSGTVESEKVIAWIDALKFIMSSDSFDIRPRTVRSALKRLESSTTAHSYLKRRIEKFHPSSLLPTPKATASLTDIDPVTADSINAAIAENTEPPTDLSAITWGFSPNSNRSL
jgi:hypothetical protein